MATAEATREFSKETKDLGDRIVGLTLKAAKELPAASTWRTPPSIQ